MFVFASSFSLSRRTLYFLSIVQETWDFDNGVPAPSTSKVRLPDLEALSLDFGSLGISAHPSGEVRVASGCLL